MASKPGKTTSPGKARTSKKPEKTSAVANGLLVTISGVRGIAGESLTAAAALTYVDAFARLVKGQRVVVAHDARPSSKWLIPIVEGTLRSRGMDVVMLGLAPTPTVGLMVRKLKAAGGICVTASHNPIQYNGLKFFHSGGEFITQEMLNELKSLMANPQAGEQRPGIGKRAQFADATEIHLQTLLAALPPPERVRASKRPSVIIDCCNSAGAEIAPDVADAYGALFQLIFSDTTKFTFPRGAEPIEQNISALRRAVIKEDADIGFAIDPDADRLALVDEKGNALGEERTLLLAADAFLSATKKKSPIVVNLSTSQAMDDLARHHGVKLYRTPIGEANVMAGIRKHKARIGGEGNGGVIVPAVQPGRDAATAIALILVGLQARGGTLSEWNASFPNYVMKKESVPLGNISVPAALAKVRRAFSRERKDETDGLKVSFTDSWLHVRPSNTEPIVRIFVEAPTEEVANDLIERAVALLT